MPFPFLSRILATSLAASALASCGGEPPPGDTASSTPVPFADLDYQDERFFFGGEPFSGTAFTFYPDGKTKKSEIEFHDGAYHGLVREWWENGNPQAETTFYQGMRHGINTYWDKDGSLIKEQVYDMDTVVDETGPK